MRGPGRIAVPDGPGQGGRAVPHRPVPAGAPTRQGPRRPGPAGPQARLGLDRDAPPSIAGRLVIATGKKKGRHPSPATVMRMLREHDEKTAAAAAAG
jgi:hypothetical protein